jgi:hypothetical protein
VRVGVLNLPSEPLFSTEYFNENYVESEKYPTGVFGGKSTNPSTSRKTERTISRPLTDLKFTVLLRAEYWRVKGPPQKDYFTFTCSFDIKLAEYKIDIPTVVVAKIAESIAVKNTFAFTNLWCNPLI